MKIKLVVLLILTIVLSCKSDPNKQIDEGKITENTYHSDEIGWTMNIPNGWNVTHRSVLNRRSKKGLDIIKESTGLEYDDSELKQLLNFQKNRFNIFQSTSEPFEVEYDGEWEDNNTSVKALLYDLYTEKGIKTDTTATKIANIDGLSFHYFTVTLYKPNGDVLLNQSMYGRLINGFDFGVNINYNNEEDKNEMLEAWLNSKFDQY
ncbi:hypothetical protein [Winogradskyella algicola]|uniref:hypothetical protein n=1 Tax=Winogradskyella algicola TaxID=2575815 RepID=UPI0011093C41|nr:hypothetical protein [Winogradskyella algicola]